MRKILIIVILVFLLLFSIGFVIPFFLSSENIMCTEMGCPCEGVEGERSCNSWTLSKSAFTSGLVNIVEKCQGRDNNL